MTRVFSSILLLFALALSLAFAQDYATDLSVDHPAIRWFQATPDNPVSRLASQLDSGKVKLTPREDQLGFLPGLLEGLGINVDSQALVFSKTSFQAAQISPTNPRAIYFTDDVAVGYVRGSNDIEIAATDNTDGVVFYTANLRTLDKTGFERRDVCLKCHQGPNTAGVPGTFIGSVFPGPLGTPVRGISAIITDHRTAFEDRWGGWYINAKRGQQHDRSNAVASNPAQPEVLDEDEPRQNLTTLLRKFNPNGYLSPISDIVALMTFEHQTQMTNFFTRVGWESRMNAPATQLDADIEALVTYMLFAEETKLPEPLEGVSTFTQTFPKRGPRDHKGRSLRDFDLQTRLFKYPLSYMIYSSQFDGLPESVRTKIYKRLSEILTGQDKNEKFVKLSAADRQSILEILKDTKPGF